MKLKQFWQTRLLVLLFCFAPLLKGCIQYQRETPDDLALKILEALQQNDFSLLQPAIVDAQALELLYDALQAEQQGKRISPEKIREMAKAMETNLKQDFERLQKNAKTMGIIWERTHFQTCKAQYKKEGKFEEATLEINFTIEKRVFKIKCTAFKIDHEWFLAENLQWI